MSARLVASTLLVAILGVPAPTLAQDVATDLGGLDAANAEAYVRPLAEGLARSLSAGFADGGRPLGRLRWNVGVRISGPLFREGDAAFEAVLPSSITWNGTTYTDPYEVAGESAVTPTAVGTGQGVTLRPRRDGQFASDLLLSEEGIDAEIALPDGLDLPVAPFVVFEAAVGLGAGTQISAHFLPPLEMTPEVGSTKGAGLVVLHSLNRYFPGPLPVDLAGAAGYHKLSVGDYLDANATMVGVVASRRLGTLALFGHGSFATAFADVEYTAVNATDNPGLPGDGETVTLSLDPGSQVSAGLGAAVDLTVLQLSGEYTLADYNSFSVKLSLGVR